MLISTIESKIMKAYKQISEPTAKKGVKFYMVGKSNDEKLVSEINAEEEKINTGEERVELDDYDLDLTESVNIITTKIEQLVAQVTVIAKNVIRHIIKESR
mmetsp:Transcript_34310/g.39642  ORF Transcript_34310/g.39642 Transcript_34310/m.39642 type:complete len:101 (-) Transcript_34310:1061-1363(-)